MEGFVKKYQQRFRKVKEEMHRWDEFQSRFLSQFTSASAIIQRLQLIQDPKNFATLKCVEGIEDDVLVKQMESLTIILVSLNKTMEDFKGCPLTREVKSKWWAVNSRGFKSFIFKAATTKNWSQTKYSRLC